MRYLAKEIPLVLWIAALVVWAVILMGVLVWGIDHGKKEGRSMALKEVLHTNPPSEELEMVCAGLWIGEQNKKYWNKDNANKSK